MGIIGSYLKLGKLSREMEKKSDVGLSLATMQSKMNAANGSMAALVQQQAAAQSPVDAARMLPARAAVTSAVPTGTSINGAQLVELVLVVMLEGGVVLPVSRQELVQPIQFSRLQPGAVLAVSVDPARLDSLRIDWDTVAA